MEKRGREREKLPRTEIRSDPVSVRSLPHSLKISIYHLGPHLLFLPLTCLTRTKSLGLGYIWESFWHLIQTHRTRGVG